MLKASKMSRIRIIIHKKYFEKVLSAIQDVSVMQIETLPEKTISLLGPVHEMNYKEISDNSQRFRGLESLLIPKGDKKFSFENIEQLISEISKIKIDERISQIKKETDQLQADMKEANGRLTLLKRISDYSGDLSILNTKNIISFAVYGKELSEFEKEAATISDVLVTKLQDSLIVSMKKDFAKGIGAVAQKYRVTLEFIPEMRGYVEHNKAQLDKSIAIYSRRERSLNDELTSISEKYYPIVSAIREQLDIEMEKVEIISKLGVGKSIIAIEGWISASSFKNLYGLVKDLTDNRFILENVKTKDTPPTKMQNPVGARLYEFFVRFYSIPQSREIDPTIMFALIFPIFFGFMVGDAGYGIFMLALALWIIHRIDHPPRVSRLPRALTSFVSLLVSRNSLKILAKSIIPGAIIAIILGILFNQYFGFQLPYATPFNVEQNLAQLLVIAGWIGVFMVEFGFFLGFLNKVTEGERSHAIAKIGWMLAGAGFVIFGLNILHHADLGIDNIISLASYISLIVGIGVILKYEGGRGIMELPSLISHMLSYTRLVGILLASVILADVVDLVFTGGWHHSILLGIAGTLILIVGQLFNIVIALFEPGIQGARLIYVEFFSKFYEGNGKLFKPFASQRNRTLTRFKLEESQ